jgi:hypothetical protein
MKTTILFLLMLSPILSLAQVGQTGSSGGGSIDSANFAKITDLLYDASNASEMPYVDGDTIRSRPFYSAPCWTLDSTVLSLYGTTFNRTWFRTTQDSLAVDSVFAVLSGATTDTVTFRVLWGVSRGTPTDSLSDLKCFSLTVGTLASSTKVIPPFRMVWMKLIEKDGTPSSAFISLNGRRKW